MKKITLLFALFAMSLLVVACGSTSNTNDQNPVIEDNPSDQVDDSADNPAENDEINGEENSGANGENTDETNGNDPNSSDDDEVTKMQRLDYVDFELEVEYGNHQDYEVELELKHDSRVKAEIEDDVNGVKKEGAEAFDELYPLVEQLTITQSTSKEDAIQEVLKVFNLDPNYEEFEAEIKFKDGTKIEFKDKK